MWSPINTKRGAWARNGLGPNEKREVIFMRYKDYYKLIFILGMMAAFLLVCNKARADLDTIQTVSQPLSITESAIISSAVYLGCRQLNDKGNATKLGCAVASIIITNIIMYCDFHTESTDSAFKRRLSDHIIGATIGFTIPMALGQ